MSIRDFNDRQMRLSLDRYITGNYGEDQFQDDEWERMQPVPYREWAWGKVMRAIYGHHLYYPMWHERSFTHQHFWRVALPARRKRRWKRHMAKVWRWRKRGWQSPHLYCWDGMVHDPGEYYGAGAVQLRDLP